MHRRGEATISEDQILARIHEMGYITLKPMEVNPSYYDLKDGTIIEAGIRIEAVVPDPRQPNGYNVRTSNYAMFQGTPEIPEDIDPSPQQNSLRE